MLPGFSKNLLAAIKTIEGMVGGFQGKIKSVEKDLWREYQTLENHLEQRTKKLDRLEAIVRNGIVTGQINPHSPNLNETQARLVRLEDAYRQLKVENHTLRAAADARRAAYAAAEHNSLDSPGGGSPSPSVPTGPKAKASASKIPKSGSRSTLSRPVTSTSSITTPSRSTSQHYFSQHHSRQSLAAPGADEIGVARSRGTSPATPVRSSGGVGGDDDTLTLSTPTQASHSHQERGRDRSRGRSNNTAHPSSSTALATTTTTTTSSSTNTLAHNNNNSTSNNNTPTTSTPGINTASGSGPGPGGAAAAAGGVVDTKWMLRLKDLEYKLKAEREARLMDRGEAMKRISASENENAALRGDLEKERERRRAAGR